MPCRPPNRRPAAVDEAARTDLTMVDLGRRAAVDDEGGQGTQQTAGPPTWDVQRWIGMVVQDGKGTVLLAPGRLACQDTRQHPAWGDEEASAPLDGDRAG